MNIYEQCGSDTCTQVFVYGSLKRGFGNHRFLQNSRYLGACETVSRHKMVSLGAFPGVVWLGGRDTIKGEVYDVRNENDRVALDNLEGYPTFYSKERIWTTFGPAYMYVLSSDFLAGNDCASYPAVEEGEWKHAS